MTDKTNKEATGDIAVSDSWLDDIFTGDEAADGGLDMHNNQIILGNGAFMRGTAHCEDFNESYGNEYTYD